MRNSITVGDHEVKAEQGTYEDFDGDGNPVMRSTGRTTWWCSCGAKGAGLNAETSQEIRDHLGLDENGEVIDRGHSPDLAEVRALTDQLRTTIAELDERIEARARQLADEQANTGDATALLNEARHRIEQAGEAMRREMIANIRARPDQFPEPDASRACELMANMPAWMWTNSAASLFFDMMERDRRQAEGEQRG